MATRLELGDELITYDKVEYFLVTDPAFEAFHRTVRESGFSVSFLVRDSFEETIKEDPNLRVFRMIQTVVGSYFDVAVDKKHHYILVTAEVPENAPAPPLTVEKGQQLNLTALKHNGHSS